MTQLAVPVGINQKGSVCRWTAANVHFVATDNARYDFDEI
jgi:hypothetical protein